MSQRRGGFSAHFVVLYALTLTIGFFSAAHMPAFSTAADVVRVGIIGQASALVSGVMFVTGGLPMTAPGRLVTADVWSVSDVRKAFIPIIASLAIAVAVALFMKETHPKEQPAG